MTKQAYSRPLRSATPAPHAERHRTVEAPEPIICPYAFELEVAREPVETRCRCVVCR